MTEAAPLFIAANPREQVALRTALGGLRAHVVVQGMSLHGYRSSAIFMTPGVDTTTDWYQEHALTRLAPEGAGVFRITPDWWRGLG